MNKRQKKKFKKKGYHRKCLGRDEIVIRGCIRATKCRSVFNKSENTTIHEPVPKPLTMTGTVFSGSKYARYDYRFLTKEGISNEQASKEEI